MKQNGLRFPLIWIPASIKIYHVLQNSKYYNVYNETDYKSGKVNSARPNISSIMYGHVCHKCDNTHPWTAPNGLILCNVYTCRLNLMKCKTVFAELEQLHNRFQHAKTPVSKKVTIWNLRLASKDTLFGVHHIERSLKSNTNFLPQFCLPLMRLAMSAIQLCL